VTAAETNELGARRARLFYNVEDRPLTVARGGTGEQRPNGVNGLAVTANHAADIPSSKLQLKDGCSAIWNFSEHHIVRKFNQLPDDELKEFSHASKD
jgi:hypothetical protein